MVSRSIAALTGAGAALAALATPALAWNGRGHMVVAAIAWSQMTPQARSRAGALLKLNPLYAQFTANVRPRDKARFAFMRAATWPDIIRTAPGYRADPIDDPGATQNIGYADKLQHRYWHYKDLPFSPDGTPTQPPPEPNAETQIRALRTALASPTTSDDVKSYDMVWLEHLVGDVHQPLHATSRFTAALPAGDRGGNSIAICRATAAACSKQSAKALHSFWDDALGTSSRPESAATKARGMVKAPADKAAVDDPAAWLEESLAIAKAAVYAAPVPSDGGPATLSRSYEIQAGSFAEQRAALAGARLARLLNAALGGQ